LLWEEESVGTRVFLVLSRETIRAARGKEGGKERLLKECQKWTEKNGVVL